MQIVTADLLQRLGVKEKPAKIWQDPLSKAGHRYQINTPTRVEDWLGQLIVESKHLTKTRENLYYSTPARLVAVWPTRFTMQRMPGHRKRYAPDYVCSPEKLANAVYSGRMGNGDEASGDGWRFSGGGIGMLTGRSMWAAYAKHSGNDVVNHPDLFDDPYVSADAAAWVFAVEKSLLDEADANLVTLIRERYNGGHIGLDETKAATKQVRAYFAEMGVMLGDILEYRPLPARPVKVAEPEKPVTQVQPPIAAPAQEQVQSPPSQPQAPQEWWQHKYMQQALNAGTNELVSAVREIIAAESVRSKYVLMKDKPWWWSKLVGVGLSMMATAIGGYFTEKGLDIDKDVLINALWIALFAFGSAVTVIRIFFTKTVLKWRKNHELAELR